MMNEAFIMAYAILAAMWGVHAGISLWIWLIRNFLI